MVRVIIWIKERACKKMERIKRRKEGGEKQVRRIDMMVENV